MTDAVVTDTVVTDTVVTDTVVTGSVSGMAQVMQMYRGGSLLHQVAREISTHLDRRFALLGLTTQQAALLLNASGGGMSPGQLMDAVGTDTAGMTKLLDRLEDKGLVRRCPNPADRRSVLIEATERGLALAPGLAPVFGEVTQQLFEGFTDDELTTLASFLRRMGGNLQS
jgi:DNA-binding MarR family transcriptional regulator